MRWILALLICAALSVSGCTITVKPIPTTRTTKKKRSYHQKSRHYPSSRTVQKPARKPEDSPNIKETWWYENYQKLEAAHGDYRINADADVKPLPDGRFWVPDAVLNHYQDLLLSKPTPQP